MRQDSRRGRGAQQSDLLALAILPDGTRDILGLWIEQTEGAKFWMMVFADLRARAAGLPGDDAADMHRPPIATSLDFGNWKERKPLATALWPIYTAPSAEAAAAALDAFARGPWGKKFPTVRRGLLASRLPHVLAFSAFPPDVRRRIYTPNALESVHAQLRKIIKTRSDSPTARPP